MTDSPPQRIVVVRLGALGDVVNALVFATAIKDAWPGVHLGWVVHPLARPLVENHPAVDRVHGYARGGGLRELRRLSREMRAERYTLAVDLQRIQKSALVARASGAADVLGYDRARAKELSWIWSSDRIPPAPGVEHMVEQYLAFARHLGVEAPRARRVLPRDREAEAWADALVEELGGPPLLLNLGATKPANRWEPRRWGELARALLGDGAGPVCFTGGPDDRGAVAQALAAVGDGPPPRDLVGATSIPQLIALSRVARGFVGCDTGPMHVAAAVGTPVIALFGPADPERTGPFGDEHRVLRVPPPCAPCNRKLCNQPRHACMEDLTVGLVSDAVREHLDRIES